MPFSCREGWEDLIRIHPSVMKLFGIYVIPMLLIPPAMFLYAVMVTPGAVFPALVPQITAFAPTPLWLSALALFISSIWVNGLAVAVAWVVSAALIYRGVVPLFKLADRSKARLMGPFVLMAGVIAWAAHGDRSSRASAGLRSRQRRVQILP
ncbi:hypothetical protein ACKVEX_11675 [Rhodocyclaceae bacterium SMB388]